MTSSLEGKKLGNYQVVELLGQGGMATVYIGYQESVDRKVAIKVLPPHPGLNSQFIERFQLEARTVARLQHPHILPLYDYGTQDGIFYLVMAYVDGGTLEDMVEDGPMPPTLVEKLLHEMAGALDYAHRQSIIHRDIKPGNILLDGEGHALLADFGIAKLQGGESNLTGTAVVGTPAYMSPEQAQGNPIDSRSDIYSLGVVIYQMLTGEQPFTGDTLMQVVMKVIQEPPPDILEVVPHLPPALSGVMAKALAKDPDMRYQTATAFAQAFSQALQSGGGATQTFQQEDKTTRFAAPPVTTRLQPKAEPLRTDSGTIIVQNQTNPLVLLGGFGVIAVALILAVLLIINNMNGDDDTPEPATTAPEVAQQATTASEAPTEPAEILPTDAPALPDFGRVSYSTTNTLGDSLSVRVEGLRAPGSGQVYVAWLLNTQTETVLPIGELTVDAIGEGGLSFTDEEGRMLPGVFNAIAITLEERGAVRDTPSGDAIYRGEVPVELSTALSEIFISSPDGLNEGSLLEGALIEARNAAQHAGLASRASNIGGMHNHAEHTINILRGETEDYDGSGRGDNPGRGVGVYFFVDAIETRLGEAVANASRQLQADAEIIRTCLSNTRIRADRIIELEQALLAELEDVNAVQEEAAESTRLAEELQTGFDLNQDGQIDPFEGECGLEQIETFGLLTASLLIHEGEAGE